LTDASVYNQGNGKTTRPSFDFESKFKPSGSESKSSRKSKAKNRLLRMLSHRRGGNPNLGSQKSSKSYRIEKSYRSRSSKNNPSYAHDNLSMDHVYEIHKRDELKQLHKINQKSKKQNPIHQGSLIKGDRRLNKSDSNDIRGIFSPLKKNVRIMREKCKLQK
jgi:hypothetical protein